MTVYVYTYFSVSGYNQRIVEMSFFRIEFLLCRCVFLKKTARHSRGNFAYGKTQFSHTTAQCFEL